MAKVKTAFVYLNTTVDGHLIEDGEVMVDYIVYPPEPDVGYPNETFELDDMRSRKGRPLHRIYRQLDDKAIDSIQQQIIDSFCYGS